MYAAHFNLREPPFSIAPDPAFLYMSARHQEALGHLLYGTGQYGGFVQLTGEVGTGKTTILRTLLAQKLENVDIAMIHNPRQSEAEFVASICDELGVPYPKAENSASGSIKVLVDTLNEHLLKAHAAGRRTVLIIDEAQNLPQPVLEQVRLLTNLETDKEKLLRIMLVGQPELADQLARPDLRQLASRITARFHLTPLPLVETVRYIIHRLHVAGGAADLFSESAMRRVHQYSRGIPRQINSICDRALLGAYAKGLRTVTPVIVDRAAVEVLGEQPPLPGLQRLLRGLLPKSLPLPWVETVLAVAALLIAGVLLFQAVGPRAPGPAPLVKPAAAAAPPAGTSVAASPAAQPLDAGPAALRVAAEPLPAVMSRLIGLWLPQLSIPHGENTCRYLSRQGLECYKGSTTWNQLRLMNRPAILTLDHEDGSRQFVLLRRLSADGGLIDTPNGSLRVSNAQLAPLWSGEFLLLWQPPTRETKIGPQSSPESIGWLRRALARVEGRTLSGPVPTNYGPELRAQMIRFQSTRGLDADGIAGTRTLIALASLDRRPGTPTLEGTQ